MPLRSALGYGLLPLQGEHVIFIAILSSVYTYKGEEAQLPLLFLLRHDASKVLRDAALSASPSWESTSCTPPSKSDGFRGSLKYARHLRVEVLIMVFIQK